MANLLAWKDRILRHEHQNEIRLLSERRRFNVALGKSPLLGGGHPTRVRLPERPSAARMHRMLAKANRLAERKVEPAVVAAARRKKIVREYQRRKKLAKKFAIKMRRAKTKVAQQKVQKAYRKKRDKKKRDNK